MNKKDEVIRDLAGVLDSLAEQVFNNGISDPATAKLWNEANEALTKHAASIKEETKDGS